MWGFICIMPKWGAGAPEILIAASLLVRFFAGSGG
jgi:hypothetical protein